MQKAKEKKDLVDHRRTVTQQCNATMAQDNETLGCRKTGTFSRGGKVLLQGLNEISPGMLCTILVAHVQDKYIQTRTGAEASY